MAVLLFSLRNVPDDEAQEIRELLTSNDVAFYETPAGRWGISAPGIWLQDERALRQARSLIEDYQRARFVRQRREYEHLKAVRQHRTILDAVKENPFRFIFYSAIVVVVLYFSITPFFGFGR